MPEHPKVFISYSHDSPEHKRWVSELGAKLRHNGIDAILDQWDVGPGDDITLFMESGLKNSDRVLVICTDTYVSKANAGEGGVGYERQIVTAQLIQNLGTNKFIPVIRQASGEEKAPTFLATRMYIDLRDEGQFDTRFDKLLHELHQEPIVQKPPLGKNPFTTIPSGPETSSSEGLDMKLPNIPEQVGSALDAYSSAVKIARLGDVFGWRKFTRRIQENAFRALVQWRQNKLDGRQPENEKQLLQVVDQSVGIISPVISIALAGIESGREQFRDQRALFDDLQNIVGWSRTGKKVWVEIPDALGYVYHSLHGSLSIITNQLDLAMDLAQVRIPLADGVNHFPLWKSSWFMGCSNSLGGYRTVSWKYLIDAYETERWNWLGPIFGSELEYRTSMVAYYMALSVHELAAEIASGKQNELNTMTEKRFSVPLTFISEGKDINEYALALLLRNPQSLNELWTSVNVTRKQVQQSWDSWIRLSKEWLWNIPELSFDGRVYHENLFEVL